LISSLIFFAISNGEILGIPNTESVRCMPSHIELIDSILSKSVSRTFGSAEILGGLISYIIVIE